MLAESRLPVGSSHNMIDGWTASARATATRWRSPPDRWSGRNVARCSMPDPLEGGDRPAPALALGHALVHPAEHHVLERRAMRQQMERLEHEAEPLGAQPRPFALGQARHVAPVELVDAGARTVEQAEHVEQRRLARPRRSDDGDVLARRRS